MSHKQHILNGESSLVLEGGGMRGVFTCGVLDNFMDRGIHFPYAIGVSAGHATVYHSCHANAAEQNSAT